MTPLLLEIVPKRTEVYRDRGYDSANAERTKTYSQRMKRLAKIHRSKAHKCKNWCHQTSQVLANTASEVKIEDLSM